MQMRILFSVAAILAWIVGGLLLLMPARFYAPIGLEMTPMLSTVAQAHGATLIGLGLINWLARGVTDRPGLIAILSGNLLVQFLSLVVAIRSMDLGGRFTPSILLHVLLGGAFGYYLSR